MYCSSKNIRLLVILLLIFSVGLSSLYTYEENKEAKKSKKELASKNQKGDNKAAAISKPVELEAVVPFFSFDLLKDSYLIIKIDFLEDLITEFYTSEPIYTSKYFKTLFCFVISPNAP